MIVIMCSSVEGAISKSDSVGNEFCQWWSYGNTFGFCTTNYDKWGPQVSFTLFTKDKQLIPK